MINRNDLAKQFELVVQQEIKNHNDSILATNQSINEMRKQIESLKEECADKDASMACVIEKHSGEMIDLSEMLQRMTSSAFSKIVDAQLINKQHVDSLKSAMDIKESYFLTHSDFEQFRFKIDEWMAQIQRSFQVQNSKISDAILKSKEAHLPKCDELDKKFMKRLCDEINEIEKINQSLDIFAVNFDGIKQEIEALKKRFYVVEKNIENIYTQITRLKDGVS